MDVGRRIELRGIVQGVGFRPWVYRIAREGRLTGRVSNEASGVTIDVFGSPSDLDDFIRRLKSPPPAAEVYDMQARPIPVEPLRTFEITESHTSGERVVSIPADLATCPECISEIFDPANRRFRYAFTNCTTCGPRFTIARDAPYDRQATTVAAFEMCDACRREYEDPGNRRFHAQPNACPACGPRLQLTRTDGSVFDDPDPIHAAAAALAAGSIVAIKGLGGFHLACDATAPPVVQRLRERKQRDEKPFAVMVRDLDHAERLAVLDEEERALLTSVERPIVLVRRRPGCDVATGVAPNSSLVGLMLPYTPLHHLLMHDAKRPLVMTSANLAEEPLVYRNAETYERLGKLADLLLVHDREIESRCDDSVARVIAGKPALLRRSRGYVPRAITLRRRLDASVLACGALLKNTFCLADGCLAVLSPHIGDLDNLETYRSFEEAVVRLSRFLGVRPEVIAYDLHPTYLSTRYALQRSESIKIGVQHHHAHVASVMAEHGIDGPVIGVAFDGTGYGTDGTAWGGEVLLARDDSFERIATLRPIPLAGGDVAIRHPWRIALALLEDAFEGHAPLDAFPIFESRRFREVEAVRQMLTKDVLAPRAHGAGRYFDGLGALVLERPTAHYEGQIALEWNCIAEPSEDGGYGYAIDRQSEPWTIDLREMVVSLVGDLLAGTPAPILSARFHNTLVAATAAAVRLALRAHRKVPVVLSGGCFQNPRLAGGLAAELTADAAVFLPSRVPPGDGGISLGQAIVANAVARRLTR